MSQNKSTNSVKAAVKKVNDRLNKMEMGRRQQNILFYPKPQHEYKQYYNQYHRYMHHQNNKSQSAVSAHGIINQQADQKVGYTHRLDNIEGQPTDKIDPNIDSTQKQQGYYMGKGSNCVTSVLCLHFFSIIPSYFTHFMKHQFIKYRPQYEPMISTKYLWHRFRNKNQKFNLLKELFLSERAPIITTIFISAIIGVLALAGAYFQRYLFAQLIDPTFSTSGWVYFGLISALAILRFFLFNWVQSMANQIAINIRCYLQNALVRVIFYVPQHMSEGLLLNNLFLSAEILRNAVKLIPYFVMSVVIVFGIVGFIIGIVGHIGWIVLGLLILTLIIEFFMLKKMLHWHHEYVRAADNRTSLFLTCTENMMKLAKTGQSKTYFMMMDESRKKQTQIDMKYNTFDGLIEVLIESISFLTVFVLYLVSESTLRNTGESYPNYREIFQTVILFSVFKTPIKMVAYGLSIGLDGHAALARMQTLFDKSGYIPPVHQDQTFQRTYPIPTIFQSTLEVKGQKNITQNILEQTNQLNPLQNRNYKGKMLMVLGKVDANPNCDVFIKSIIQNIPASAKYYKIDYDALIEDKSIKDNIILGDKYDQKRYNEILDLVSLRQVVDQFQQRDETKMHENYFKTIYTGLELRIQLARALYSNVDLLIINRLVFKEYESILKNVKKYMNQRGQTTVIVNLSGSYYNIADWLVLLGPAGQRQQGTYEELTTTKKSQILEQFQTQYHLHQKLVEKDIENQNKNLITLVHKLEEQPVDFIKFKFTDFFSFYNLSHYGAPIVLGILIILPPLLDLYTEVIVAESAKAWQKNHQSPISAENVPDQSTQDRIKFDHIITLRYGITVLTIFVINIVKVVLFSVYLRFSAYRIVRKMANTLFASKIQQMLVSSNRRNALNLQVNIENIDTRITADLDVGMTIIFQLLTALIFGAVSSLLFLAIGIPFLIVTFSIILVMIKFNRKILWIRRQARSKFNSFIKKLIIHRQSYVGLNKKHYISNQFIKNNKIDILADLNQQWMMQALGIILQIVFILLLIITMVVSLVKFEEIQRTNPAFIELSISFLIGLTNGGRINLKIFQLMDGQLVGITSMFMLIDRNQHKKKFDNYYPQQQSSKTPPTAVKFPESIKLDTLDFINFNVKFHDDILKGINLSIKNGDRIVVTGSRRGGKTVVIYSIMGIFEDKHINGDISINNYLQIYRDQVPRQLISKMISVLDGSNYAYMGNKTIEQGLKMSIPHTTNEQIQSILKKIWSVLQIQPLFNLQTVVHQLSTQQKDLVSLLRGLLLKPEIMVIEGGFNHLSATNRRKITQWLISNKQIPILMDLTNRIEVIQLYKRHLHFENCQLVHDETIS